MTTGPTDTRRVDGAGDGRAGGAVMASDRDSAVISVLLDVLEPAAGVWWQRGHSELARQALDLLDAATLAAARRADGGAK